MSPVVQQVANEYKTGLRSLYGSELAELILFGSYARGDNREESDIDFAVVLRDAKTRPSAELVKISIIGSRLFLKYGIPISALTTSLQKKQTSTQGIYQEIRKEGSVI